MNREITNDLDDDDDEDGNIGLVFGQGIFCRSEIAERENTAEVMSYLMPAHQVVVQAFLVKDFEQDHDMGVEVIPNLKTGVAFVRIDQNLWNFIEDIAENQREATLYQGMVLGEILVGTAIEWLRI